MIPKEKAVEIVRLARAEHWPIGTIATQLGVHHSVVRRVLAQHGMLQARQTRPSIADPYLPFIQATLDSSGLYQMAKERGYPGGPDHFRAIVARHRPPPSPEAYLRLRTLPGEQAQVDWGHLGKVEVEGGTRHLYAFVMVLSFSRRVFARFYMTSTMAAFVQGHVEAFEYFGGVARLARSPCALGARSALSAGGVHRGTGGVGGRGQ